MKLYLLRIWPRTRYFAGMFLLFAGLSFGIRLMTGRVVNGTLEVGLRRIVIGVPLILVAALALAALVDWAGHRMSSDRRSTD